MAVKLSEGAIKTILNGGEVNDAVLQILVVKPVKSGENPRYRLKLSDGKYHTFHVMLATQLNPLVENVVTPFTVIKLQRYVVNFLQGSKKVIIVLGIELIVSGEDIGGIIGNPEQCDTADQDASNTNEASNQNSSSRLPAPTKAALPAGVHPISSLNPYQNKWTIRARVTNKSNIRTWSNSKGQGKLFSMDLLDDTGEIRATAFNDQCDKYYDMIEVGKVYMVSQCSLKTANKQFSSLKNDYEMTFNPNTQVSLNLDSDDVPTLKFDFVSIADVESIDRDAIIDVIGICKESGAVETIVQKSTGKDLKKRDLQIVDESSREVRMTLWGTQAEIFDGSLNPIVAVKGVKVSDFNGKSLSCLSNSTLQINPDIKESHRLRAWYENSGQNIESVNLSGVRGGAFGISGEMFLPEVRVENDDANFWKKHLSRNYKKTYLLRPQFRPDEAMGEAVALNLGCGEKADYYTAKVMPTVIRKENSMYAACPAEGCNKKVVDMNNGIYRCEKCNKEYDTFQWRLLINVCLTDGTGSVWATVFQDQAEILLGTTADKLGVLKEQDDTAYQAVFNEVCFKEFVAKLRVKMEVYNEESRLKSTVASLQPLVPTEYNRVLIEQIKKLSGVS